MNNTELIQKLEELPGTIRNKTLEILEIQNGINKCELSITASKTQAMEIVLTKGDATNATARTTAQMLILEKDLLYVETSKTLQAMQISLRYEQAQLELLHNQFRAYIAIANMMANPAVY
jgi:hypothetical protein